ncbi:MAG: TetR/AcrR family transcriptional regulator [Acidimicrobiia bacterium]|nr:TetR/AcrR family transcriptional regulator [Acidimicrobiia bacterium]
MTSDEPPPSRSSLRQERADTTRRQLLDAARDVFEEKGYRATTIRAITSRASTAQGTFYLHFENKEDAFGQVLAEVWQGMLSMVDWEWEGDPREITRSAVQSVIAAVAMHPGIARALLEGSLDNETIEARWMASRAVLIERIAELIAKEQSAGRARDLDPLLAAHALGSMVEWVALNRYALAPERHAPGVDAMVDAVTDLWYHAVYRGHGSG